MAVAGCILIKPDAGHLYIDYRVPYKAIQDILKTFDFPRTPVFLTILRFTDQPGMRSSVGFFGGILDAVRTF